MVQFWFWVTVVGLANDDEEERGDGNSGMGEEDEDDGVFVQLTPPQTDDPAAASRKGCRLGPCGQAWLIQFGRSSRIMIS